MKRTGAFFLFTASLLAGSQLFVAHAQIQAGPNLNGARMAHHAARLPDGRIAVFGGHGPGFVSLATAEIWNPQDNTFTTINMNYPHDAPAFTRLADGRFLIAGGSSNLGIPAYATGEIFDPTTGVFTKTGDMVRFRAGTGAATLKSGKVLIAGAWWVHNDAHTYGEVFDPEAGVFSQTGALNVPRAFPVVLPADDGKAVVVGGMGVTGGSIEASLEVYDPESNSFTLLGNDLFPGEPGWKLYSAEKWFGDNLLANGKILLSAVRASETTLLTFDPATKEFAKLVTSPSLPTSESLWYPLVDVAKNQAIIPGFIAGASPARLNLHRVDLATGALNTIAIEGEFPNAYALSGTSATLLNDGRVMMIGGTTRDNFTAIAYTVFITGVEEISLEIEMYAGIQIRGSVGSSYRVEWTNQAGDPNWTTAGVVTLTSSPYLYIDISSNKATKRIYRAVLVE